MKTRPDSPFSLRVLVRGLGAAALVMGSAALLAPMAASLTPAAFQDDEEEEDLSALGLDELVDRIAKKRDDVDPAVLKAIAELQTRDAMEALLAAYDDFASIYMRRAVIVQLGAFDRVDDAFEPALEKVADVVGAEEARELRTSAVETLGNASMHGKPFLALIVESAAEDQLRERAMELHIRMGGEEDLDWYRKIYERDNKKVLEELKGGGDSKGKRKKGKRKKKDEPEPEEEKKEIAWPTPKLRALAMGAIASTLEVKDLEKAITREDARQQTLIITALQELQRKDQDKALEYAKGLAKSPNQSVGRLKVAAVEIIAEVEGTDCAKDLLKLADAATTPELVRQKIADLLADMKDEKLNKKLFKLIGKGKGPEQAFALRATKYFDDEKYAKKVRKLVKNRDPQVVMAALESIAARRDRESIKELEKQFKKAKDDDLRQAFIQALSAIYDGENEWVERLQEYANADEVDVRNAALKEIARLGRSNMVELFTEKLKSPDWSTRLISLEALVDQRDADVIGAIVEQMQAEEGRMSVEFGKALFSLTGESFGKNAGTWRRWYEDNKGSIEVISESKLEEIRAEEEIKRLKQITNAEFFGIRIESHRVLFIIDVSGSMNEPMRARYENENGKPRIEVAKQQLEKVVQALDDNALFNILPFSGGVQSWLDEGIAESNKKTRDEALDYVKTLGAGGGTNLYDSLEKAFEDKDVDTIFVLSDGEPTAGKIIDPQSIREAVAKLNETRGVVINTISIGLDLEVLEGIAADSGGTYVVIQ